MLTQLQALAAGPVSHGSDLSFLPLPPQNLGKIVDSFSPGLVGFVHKPLQDSVIVMFDVGTFGCCTFSRVMKSAQCLCLNTKLVVST